MSRDDLWITGGLLEVLLQLAADADPRPENVLILATAAGDLAPQPGDGEPIATLDASTPVFSDFYFPEAGRAISNVFGVDLGTPAGQSQGRFLSHPNGKPDLSVTDDLHARVLVAIPPWTADDVDAYDRMGTRLRIRRTAASPPETDVEW